MHPITKSIPSQRLELCQKCVKRLTFEEKQMINGNDGFNDTQNLDEDSHDFYYEKIRFLIVDCRLEALQKEALLPNSFQLQILSECTKEYLQQQTEKLMSCKDVYHICLMGLDPLSDKNGTSNKFETSKDNDNKNDNLLDIGAYHESILRFLIEDFQKKGFKYISIVPGAFSECHELAMRYNFSLVNHDNSTCYHCDKAKDCKQSMSEVYNQQYNLGDIFNGFKNLYEAANTKLKNFVKGPIKLLGNSNTYNSANEEAVNNIQSKDSQGATSLPLTQRQQIQRQQQQYGVQENTTKYPMSLGIPAKLANQTVQETSQSSSQESLYQTMSNPPSQNYQRQQQLSQSESRNMGPHNQRADMQKQLVKTSDNLNSKKNQRVIAQPNQQVENNNYLAVNQNYQRMNGMILLGQEGSDKVSDVAIGNLPLSFISSSSRQDSHLNRFQGSHCSSNASVNSSQNDGGNNLRDAISNKKIMSYKLMSKVPGDRNSEVIASMLQSGAHDLIIATEGAQMSQGRQTMPQQQQNFLNPLTPQQQQSHPDNSLTPTNMSMVSQTEEIVNSNQHQLIHHQKTLQQPPHYNNQQQQLVLQYLESSSMKVGAQSEVQSLASPQSMTHLAIQSQYSLHQSDIDKQLSDIKILLSPSEKNIGSVVPYLGGNQSSKMVQEDQKSEKETNKKQNLQNTNSGSDQIQLQQNMQKATPKQATPISVTPKEEAKKMQTQPQDQQPMKVSSSSSNTSGPNFTEEDLYYINGLTKQVEVLFSELEPIMNKKQNIVYRAMKLHLKKKPEQVTSGAASSSASSSSAMPSIAYPVYLIITQYTVSVVRELSRRRTNLLGPVNQSIESSMSQADEWDQNDFDELHPSSENQEAQGSPPGKSGQQHNPMAMIESRFLMFDLIKITSRKSSSKIITFYFRLPYIQEYNSQVLEQNIVSQLDQRPAIKYQFAFKRKNFKEVSASFEFAKEEDAKQCIANVSSLYKKLKNSKL